MKPFLPYSIYFTVLLHIVCCSSTKKSSPSQANDVHSSMQSLDWAGSYQGVLPCADCEGIETVIKLEKELSFQAWRKYRGKSDSIYHSTGSFAWNKEGSAVTLKEGEYITTYQVGENKLIQLDKSGNIITGQLANKYVLTMQQPAISERYWKLTEIMGNPVPGENNKEPHIVLKSEGGRFTGNGGCNTLNGTYEIKDNNGITFSGIASTRMACTNMETEQQLIKALESADSYILIKDTLVLNRAKMAPLARFETVYLK